MTTYASVPVAPAAPRPRRVRLSTLGWVGAILTGAFLLLAIVGPFVLADPLAQAGRPLQAPSVEHPFGTDNLGRDLLSRTAAGARISILVAISSVGVGLLVAVPLGLLAGYQGGRWLDDAIMRFMEAIQALPIFVFALFIIGMLGTGSTQVGPVSVSPEVKLITLLAISFLPMFARVTRAATLVEMQEDYIDALRVVGVSRMRITFGELLPNAIRPVLVQAFLWVGIAIFAESALSFLGLGLQPPAPSLGTILSEATRYVMLGGWWFSVIPGTVILVVTVGINLLGDEVDALLNNH